MGGSLRALALETMVMGVFTVCRGGPEIQRVADRAGLAAHGMFDFVHAHVIDNPGVPEWWPAFCGAYDVVAAAALAWLSRGRKT